MNIKKFTIENICNKGTDRIITGAILILLLFFPSVVFGVETVRLQLKWKHQFQFAGYYAAKEKGYYKSAGLNVDFLPAISGTDPILNVIKGNAEFGIGATDLLLMRQKGIPVVVLASVFQHSPLAFMTLNKHELQTIHDLAGSRVMLEPDSAELMAYLRNEGISTKSIKLTHHTFDVNDLLSGNVDAMSVYVTTEPFYAMKAGRDVLLYSPRAAGIDFYSDNLFTTENMLKHRPETVRKFREASLKGWEYAMAHQEEVVNLIHTKYSTRRSLEALRFEAKQMVPLLQTSMVEIGHMNPGRWRNIVEIYIEMGMLKPDFNIKGFLYNPNPAYVDLKLLYTILGTVFTLLAVATYVAIRFIRMSKALTVSNINLRQREDELNKALEDIRTLSGILPICMNCKKIRDDQGYWNQVENYVRDRTDAEFSHSICPECAEKLYPDYCEDEVDNSDEKQ
jgi:two-component system sensor histidine kinase/response regulator